MDKQMSADDLCRIFCETRPKLFNHIYKECKLLFECEQGIHDEREDPEEEYFYWKNHELNIANAIVYDYSQQPANKIGKILVSATE